MRVGVGARRALRMAAGTVLLAVGCSETTRPEYVAELFLEPDSAHLALGQEVALSARPLGPQGEHYDERAMRVTWESESPEVATLDTDTGPTTTAHAEALGQAIVRATLGRGESTARIYVHPAGLASIAIDPSPVTLARATHAMVHAVLLDAQGDTLSPGGFRISWAVDDADIVFLSSEVGPVADLFGRGEGQANLRLIVGDRSMVTTVTVTAPSDAR